jgi:hypothetical protein
MSAELLALAVRAADAYAKVKGPWLQRCGLEASPDPITPHELVLRAFLPNGRRESGCVIFNPLPRKEKPMSYDAEVDDDYANNILAAGGLVGVLMQSPVVTTLDVETDDGVTATNRLVVRLRFLKSPYRLTVERIPEGKG